MECIASLGERTCEVSHAPTTTFTRQHQSHQQPLIIFNWVLTKIKSQIPTLDKAPFPQIFGVNYRATAGSAVLRLGTWIFDQATEVYPWTIS